ncbi:MAG: DUF3422 domain-containing protein [Pseudomonadota bacterium]
MEQASTPLRARFPAADPERFSLTNELHARPFPELTAPSRAIFIAIKPDGGEARDRADDVRRLTALIDRYGGAHPAPGSAHFTGKLGRFTLKWESHTEFVTYTIFQDGVAAEPFSGEALSLFPEDWLADLGGRIAASAMVRIETAPDEAAAEKLFSEQLQKHFAGESLSVAWVVGREALVASDFRIHENGFARIAVVAVKGMGPRRLGRITQRLLEIESYKAFAMTALPTARDVSGKVGHIESALAKLIASDDNAAELSPERARETLQALTKLSAQAERISTETAFRFGASAAYEAIVTDRIEVLREERMGGRQLYSEFMKRRFDPAMRTCRAAQGRLAALSERLARASSLLSTQVNVAVEAQNQELLESMNRRAALQLRLQRTVEGVSVVAISYYALNLAAALAAPWTKLAGLDKAMTTSLLAIPVIGAVWYGMSRIRKQWEGSKPEK